MTVLYAAAMVIVWFTNLLNGTGLGVAYHTTECGRYCICILATLYILHRFGRDKKMLANRKSVFIYGSMAFLFICVSYFRAENLGSLDYLWVFLLVYLIGQVKLNIEMMKRVSTGYVILGALVLFIYDYGSVLSGWNENTIAMIGLHSFLVFLVPYYKTPHRSEKIRVIVSGIAFSFLIYPTDSRSGILFAIIAVLFSLTILPNRLILKDGNRIIIWLIVPLLVAALVTVVSNTAIADKLNIWSYAQFQKPIFNGRDKIWIDGFKQLINNPLLGSGEIRSGYWHNCAIACLTAYGIVGFVLWISSFLQIIKRGLSFIYDNVVIGLILAFIVLVVQQSVELGLFAPNPNLLPYVMLGMILGRCKYLETDKILGLEYKHEQC